MFKNYFLLAIRNMRKNKLHTFINMGGMMVAFTCSIFILLLVYSHFSYDNFEKIKINYIKYIVCIPAQTGKKRIRLWLIL